jgi:hypothetical protein
MLNNESSYQEIEDEFRTYDDSKLKEIVNNLSSPVEKRKGIGWALAHSSLAYLLMVPAVSGISRALGNEEISNHLMNYGNYGLISLVALPLAYLGYHLSGERGYELKQYNAANEILDSRKKSGVESIRLNA